ncbi:PPK2 family polyphosphate kinase [Nocardioides sp.]|uniref:PPK2 family polyphosphate kinase n=1 Tax=Nocardioides sp. TaxID=35761 RepID=UPI0035134B99
MSATIAPLPPGPVDLRDLPTDPEARLAAAGAEEPRDKASGATALAALGPALAQAQERLFAHGRSGGARRVLMVLQGMDTSGKGGTIRSVLGLVDPQGVAITSFGAPTEQERAHDFLWRIERALPVPGRIGVFDRSHYEDVLVPVVRASIDAAERERRLAAIRDFEQRLVDDGVVLLKVFLHVGLAEQRARLLARLDDPAKHWKYSPDDLVDRARWSDFQAAYEVALGSTGTPHAPWHVVPADRKWYRNLAVGRLLLSALEGMGLDWPAADYDVAEQRRLLLATEPEGGR